MISEFGHLRLMNTLGSQGVRKEGRKEGGRKERREEGRKEGGRKERRRKGGKKEEGRKEGGRKERRRKERRKENKHRAYKHTTPHANGEPLLKRSSPHSLLSSSAMILLVWSANGDAPFQGNFQVNLLNDDT